MEQRAGQQLSTKNKEQKSNYLLKTTRVLGMGGMAGTRETSYKAMR
jgi:hypothetical protein